MKVYCNSNDRRRIVNLIFSCLILPRSLTARIYCHSQSFVRKSLGKRRKAIELSERVFRVTQFKLRAQSGRASCCGHRMDVISVM